MGRHISCFAVSDGADRGKIPGRSADWDLVSDQKRISGGAGDSADLTAGDAGAVCFYAVYLNHCGNPRVLFFIPAGFPQLCAQGAKADALGFLSVAGAVVGSSLFACVEVSGRLTSGSLWIQLPAVLVLAPIVEELLFRGLVFRRLAELIGSLGGMIGSAFLFGLFHGNLIQGSYAFLVGILLAWVYSRYGTVIAPILVHIWMNIAAELLRFADMKAVLYANTAVFILFLLGEAAVVAICCIGISRMGVKKEERHV